MSDALDGILEGDYRDSAGSDLRNYGGLDGIPEAKVLFAEMMGVAPGEILIGGNSSLTMMYFAVLFALQQGVAGPDSAWARENGTIKFLAPVPGYDRHFAICQQLGIEMIPVALGDNGPDMDQVETLLREDPLIKGICVYHAFPIPQASSTAARSSSDWHDWQALPAIISAYFATTPTPSTPWLPMHRHWTM